MRTYFPQFIIISVIITIIGAICLAVYHGTENKKDYVYVITANGSVYYGMKPVAETVASAAPVIGMVGGNSMVMTTVTSNPTGRTSFKTMDGREVFISGSYEVQKITRAEYDQMKKKGDKNEG